MTLEAIRVPSLGPSLALAVLAIARPCLGQAVDLEHARSEVPRLPGMTAMRIEEIVADPEPNVFRLRLHADSVSARAFQAKPGGGWQVAIRPDDPASFGLDPVLDAASCGLLEQISTSELILVSAGKKLDAPLAGFPGELRPRLQGHANSKGEIELAEGLNVFVDLSADPASRLGRIQLLLGSKGPLRLGGAVDAGTLQRVLSKAGFPAAGLGPPSPSTSIELRLTLPEYTPVPFDVIGDEQLVHLVIRSTSLKLGLSTKEPKFSLEGIQKSRLWIRGRAFDGEAVLKGEIKKGKLEIERSGKIKVDPDTFRFPGLGIEEVSLSAKIGDIPVGPQPAATQPASDAPAGRERADARADLAPPKPEAGTGAAAKASTDDGPKLELGLGAVVQVGGRKVEGKFVVQMEGAQMNKVAELRLELALGEEGGGLGLRDLPGFEDLPENDRFRLHELALGYGPENKDVFLAGKATWVERGISGRCIVAITHDEKKQPARLFLVQLEEVRMTDLIPGLPEDARLPLDKALLALCSTSLEGIKAGSLGSAIEDVLKKVTGSLDRPVTIGQGLTLMMRLDPSGFPPKLREAMTSWGVTEPMVVAGSLGGLKEGKPKVSLYANLPSLPVPADRPDFLDFEPRRSKQVSVESAGARFFLSAGPEAAGTQLQLGIDGVIGVRVGRDELQVGGRVYVVVSAVSQGIRLSGRVLGDWNEPFGLAGVQLRDLVIGGGVDVDSSIELALAGGATIGKFEYDAAGIVSVVAAAGGLVPKKLGFKFTGSELSQLTQFQLMAALVKSAVAGPLASAIPAGDTQALLKRVANVDLVSSVQKVLPLPLLEYRDVSVFLATPGATFPDIDLGGLGLGVRGGLRFMNRDLGSVDSFLTLRDGLKVNGKPGTVDLGLLTLTGAELELRVPMPGLPLMQGDEARFLVRGAAGAGCGFVSGALDLEITRDEARFTRDVQLAGYATTVTAHADLSKYPACLVEGKFGNDLVLDALEAVKAAARSKADKALAEAKAKAAEVKAARKQLRADVDETRAAAKQARRDKAQATLAELKKGIQECENEAKNPLVKAAWAKVHEAAKKMQIAQDGAASGVEAVRQKLADLGEVLKKVPGDVADAAKARIDKTKAKLDATIAAGKAVAADVEEELGVKQAKERLRAAEAAVEDFGKRLVREKVDVAAACATGFIDSLSLEDIGFDAGLDLLCAGKLPKIDLRGRFADKPFALPKALHLAQHGELAKRNAEALELVAEQLFELIPAQAAQDFGNALARE